MQSISYPTLPLPKLPSDLVYALLTALSFSAFIYAAHWELSLAWLNTLLGLLSLFGLLTLNKRAVIFSGFFIGLLWFYWIGYSFRYYGMSWAVPLVGLAFGFIYALFFGLLALTDRVELRALILFALSFFEPFDFNWMQVELIFIESWFGVEKWQFGLVLTAVALFATVKQPWRAAALLPLIGAMGFSTPDKPMPPLDIKLVATALPQELKWRPQMSQSIVTYNFDAIDNAIINGFDIVVLPESAFPLYLNRHDNLLEALKERSHRIAIATGALLDEEGKNYNVTYIFHKGEVTVAKKMVLVPFGEYIPLPAFAREWVNEAIFDGASDFLTASEPTDFSINGITFRNTVCYEATCEELYENDPPYLIAISNNGWFSPSIEPTLQRLLMKYYARKHGSIIFHAANMGGTGIVK